MNKLKIEVLVSANASPIKNEDDEYLDDTFETSEQYIDIHQDQQNNNDDNDIDDALMSSYIDDDNNVNNNMTNDISNVVDESNNDDDDLDAALAGEDTQQTKKKEQDMIEGLTLDTYLIEYSKPRQKRIPLDDELVNGNEVMLEEGGEGQSEGPMDPTGLDGVSPGTGQQRRGGYGSSDSENSKRKHRFSPIAIEKDRGSNGSILSPEANVALASIMNQMADVQSQLMDLTSSGNAVTLTQNQHPNLYATTPPRNKLVNNSHNNSSNNSDSNNNGLSSGAAALIEEYTLINKVSYYSIYYCIRIVLN